jgi:hypothetical protein
MSNTTLLNELIKTFENNLAKIENASTKEIKPQHEKQYMALEIYIKNDAVGYLEVINREIPKFRYATYDDPFITETNIYTYYKIIETLKNLFNSYEQIQHELK